MPTKNVLRILIALQVAVWIGQQAAATISLPRLVQEFGLHATYIDPVGSLFGRTIDTAFFIALFLALLSSSIGLCALSPISRTSYLIASIVTIVFGLLHGPLVRSGSMDFFHSANILLTGVVLTMVYSSPFKSMYEGQGGGPPPVSLMAQAPAVAVLRSAPPPAPPEPEPVPEHAVPAETAHVPFCRACGASTQGAKFCPECGKPVLMKKVCSRCGVESKEGEKFCRECGNPTP